MTILISTDGSGTKAGSPGGWAAVLRAGDKYKEISGSVADATNNTMELLAPIMALRELKRSSQVEITSDSQYVILGATERLSKWKRYGWKTMEGEPVKNMALWLELDKELRRHEVTWKLVKGHSGHPDNERCDVLAGEARASLMPPKPEKKKRTPVRRKLMEEIMAMSPEEIEAVVAFLREKGLFSEKNLPDPLASEPQLK
jgi:ribonuclease HI